MALTKFNFNSFDLTTVASTGLAFNSNANGFDTATAGAMTLITTNTISSGVSSSDFTSSIDSTYDTYLFKFINLHPATDGSGNELNINFRDGGSNFDATKTTSYFYAYHSENAAEAGLTYKTGNDLASSTGDQKLADQSTAGAAADEAISGEMFLFSPSSTTFVKHFIIRTMAHMSWDAAGDNYIVGYCDTTTAIDGVRFLYRSGNIDSDVIKMYGITR